MRREIFNRALSLPLGELETIIGGLSQPGKMPWFGFSTPADLCQIGSKLAQIETSPCFKCYAKKGRYRFGKVKTALNRRFEAMSQDEWGEHMAALLTLRAAKVPVSDRYFRWYDSGDVQSVQDLEIIAGIALLVPQVSFWLPTQERPYVRRYLAQYGAFPHNLAVRISSTKVGQEQKSDTGLASMVSEGEPSCPAYGQGNKCLRCRKCWDATVSLIIYPGH